MVVCHHFTEMICNVKSHGIVTCIFIILQNQSIQFSYSACSLINNWPFLLLSSRISNILKKKDKELSKKTLNSTSETAESTLKEIWMKGLMLESIIIRGSDMTKKDETYIMLAISTLVMFFLFAWEPFISLHPQGGKYFNMNKMSSRLKPYSPRESVS